MSRSDERSEQRAWDEQTPTARERLGLAIRQNPLRGIVIALLLVIALGFLAATIAEFWAGGLVIIGVGVLLLALALAVVAVGSLIVRQG